MPRVEFETAIPVFERQKTVRASDRSAPGNGHNFGITQNYSLSGTITLDQ